jgi:Ca2+-binding EF-hand superfamily protein
LSALDIDKDGMLNVDELRYFVDTHGDQMSEWQMNQIHSIIEDSTVGEWKHEGRIVIAKLVENVVKYAQINK